LILRESFRVAKHFCEQANGDDLRTQQREHHAEQHSVYVNGDVPQVTRPGEEPKNQSQAHQQQRDSGKQEEPIGRVKQHEAQAAPAVVERPQMRLAASLVGPQRDRNFCDLCPQLGRLDDQLQGKLHSGGAGINALINPFRKSAHAAICVANPSTEKVVQNGS